MRPTVSEVPARRSSWHLVSREARPRSGRWRRRRPLQWVLTRVDRIEYYLTTLILWNTNKKRKNCFQCTLIIMTRLWNTDECNYSVAVAPSYSCIILAPHINFRKPIKPSLESRLRNYVINYFSRLMECFVLLSLSLNAIPRSEMIFHMGANQFSGHGNRLILSE